MRSIYKQLGIILVLVLIGMAVATTATTAAPAAAEPKKGGTLTIALAEDPRSLNAIKDPGTEGTYVLEQVQEGLLRMTGDGKVVPRLAEAMPEMPDPQTYVFKLRKGIKFHDGTDFDANSIKWNFDFLMDKANGAQVYSLYNQYIAGVDVVDQYTIRFRLKRVWPDFQDFMTKTVYPYAKSRAAVEKYGPDYGSKAVVGTGPFKFVEWVKGDHITLERNADYWDQTAVPYVDRLIFKPITEDSTRLIAYRTGAVDVMYSAPFNEIAKLKSEAGTQVTSVTGSTIVLVIMNNRDGSVFKDKRVRQAISLGIDRKEINDVVYAGLGEVADSIFPSWHWAHASGLTPMPYDPDKAKALLAEAGYGPGKPLNVKVTTTTVTQFVDTAVLIQNQLAKIGVNVEIEQLEKSAMGAKLVKPDTWLNPPNVLLYRYIQLLPTSYYGWLTYSGKSANYNDTGYNMPGAFQNPEVEDLLDKADTTVDRAEAAKIYRDISIKMREDSPDALLIWLPTVYVQHTYVKDLPIGVFFSNELNKVWLDK